MEKIRFTVSRPQRLLFLLCAVVAGLFVSAIAGELLGFDTTQRVRVVMVVQDLMMFAVPAVATACLVTRRPADLLMIARPRGAVLALMILAMAAGIPALNRVVEWNASLPLPESWLKTVEAQQEAVNLLFGGSSAGSLVMALLIIGVMAPVTEELLFRGCLQRLLGSMTGRHAAVWIAAAVFSLAHFDMTGFVPRLLLGAIFGYAMLWSGSVWTAVVCHAFNNCLAVTAMWLGMRGDVAGAAMQTVGQSGLLLPAASAVVAVALMALASRAGVREEAC